MRYFYELSFHIIPDAPTSKHYLNADNDGEALAILRSMFGHTLNNVCSIYLKEADETIILLK